MRKFLGLLFILLFVSPAIAEDLTEQQKIEVLLDTLASSDITFVRNGEAHDGAYARQHLEEKLKETKDINTAEDFISKVASVSSHTGTPYLVKFKDGTTIEAGKWLHDQLKEIENTEPME